MRKEVKGKAERERYTHLNAEFQRTVRDRKAFLSEQCKEIEKNSKMEKTRNLFKKIREQGNISCKDGHNKGQRWNGPNRKRLRYPNKRYYEEVASIYKRTIQERS